jgi:outer membrane protein assembly factor BamA
VDWKKPPRTPWPARFLLAPFRAIAPKADRGLTYVETSNVLERLRIILSNPHLRPLFGGLGDGSGFGGGVYVSTANSLSEHAGLFFSSHFTSRRYLESTAGFSTDPTGGARRVFSLDLATRYRRRPEEGFFGIGTQSQRGQRTSYNLQERGIGLTASVQLPRRFRLGVGVDYSSNRVFDGDDDRFATIGEIFNKRSIPGIDGAALLGTSAFAEFDGRDEVGNPRAGAYIRFAATSNDSVGRGDFGFVNYLLDARGYIPLGTKRRVLALRLLGDFNDRKGGSEIPFFRLARLGTSQTLRGYDTYRFHGRNALSSNIEYRYQLVQGIEAVVFTDIGQVYGPRSEFNTNNIHATFGGGFQFNSKKSVFLRILAGKSGEGTRLFFSFGPTF